MPIISPHTGRPITSGKNGKVRNVQNGQPKAFTPSSWPGQRYSGAHPGLDRGWFNWGVPVDFWDSIAFDQQFIAANALLMYRSQPTAHAIVNQMMFYVVGTGRMPQSQSEKGADVYDAYFNEWAERVTPAGHTYQRLQQIVFKEMFIKGDVGVLKIMHKGKPMLQMIAGHRIGGAPPKDEENEVQGGVEYKRKGGEVVRYWLMRRENPKPYPVKPDEMMLVFNSEAIDQYRGISLLALCIIDLIDEASILDYTKLVLRWQAHVGGMIKKDDAEEESPEAWRGGELPVETLFPQSTDFDLARIPFPKDTQLTNTREGAVNIPVLKPNEAYEDFASKRPNQQFIPFLQHLNQRMCNSVFVPYEFLLNPNLTDGPGTRKTLQQSDMAFNNLCSILHEKLNGPVWDYVIGGAILAGKLPSYKDWRAVDWECPQSLSVDVGRESKAMLGEVAAGIKTRTEIHKAEGRKFDDVVDNLISEEDRLMEGATMLANKFGVEDVMSIRNMLASTGQVEERKERTEFQRQESEAKRQEKSQKKDSGKS